MSRCSSVRSNSMRQVYGGDTAKMLAGPRGLVPGLVAGASVAALASDAGGFDPTSWGWRAIALLLVVAASLLLGARRDGIGRGGAQVGVPAARLFGARRARADAVFRLRARSMARAVRGIRGCSRPRARTDGRAREHGRTRARTGCRGRARLPGAP